MRHIALATMLLASTGCSSTMVAKGLVDSYCKKPISERSAYKVALNLQLDEGKCVELKCPGDDLPSYCYSDVWQ